VTRAAVKAARRGLLALTFLGAPVVATACASTTYDTSIPSDPTAAPSTTLPVGSAAELLPELLTTSATLSRAITDKGPKTAIAERVQDLWNASQQEVAASRPELLGDFQANVQRSLDAAKFNRAADADKAYKNFQALVDSYLASS
jgi:hypothetical protein